ncbi:TAT-variant-translocated molybdopterin oxidoreductase [bacterium]|nr:TAT-variant-translocated molybdopterin oxidoreductase [bacterium]MBU1982773.1 TAT-variant-translocated molybdopterin oxidoreductase [bacterium]
MNRPQDISKSTHWSTLEELRGDPEVLRLKGEEFFEKPERFFDELEIARVTGQRPAAIEEAAGFTELAVLNNGGADAGMSRRDFLKLSAAAMAFATAGCALRPTEKIIPYVKAPEAIIPGVANYYATTLGDAAGTGVLVKTREGRPVKIEGNPDHPLSQGKLSLAGQLSIFNLYDPDRLKGPVKLMRGVRTEAQPIAWSTADEEIAAALKAARGRIALLTGTIHGPARTRLIHEFCNTLDVRHVTFDAWNYDVSLEAQQACYSTSRLPRYHFDKAEYFLFFGCDPLATGYSALEWSVGFGRTRKLHDEKMSKAVAFEPCLSLTGSNCDERYRVRSADLVKLALAVARELVAEGRLPEGLRESDVMPVVGRWHGSAVEHELNLPEGIVARIAHELWKHRGRGIVMAGEDVSLQTAINLINSICGNEGRTIDGVVSPSQQSLGTTLELLDLIRDVEAGKIDVVLIWNTNPVYTLPESAGFTEALSEVKTVVSLSDRVDETARLGHYVLPGLHYLESWGDAEPQVGLYSLAQPVIQPLYDNRAAEDSLLSFAKIANVGVLGELGGDWHGYLMSAWRIEVYGKDSYAASFPQFWNSALRDGVVNTAPGSGAARLFRVKALDLVRVSAAAAPELELVVCESPVLRDGSNANNAWLLECPDPVSRISWTNYASVSPATAEKLGLIEGDIVRLSANDGTAELPVHVQPGNLDGVVNVQAGWGRSAAGTIGNDVGANVFALCSIQEGHLITSGIPCTVIRTGEHVRMPCVQGHHYLEGRPIIADTSLDEYHQNHRAGQPHEHEIFSLWPKHEYPGNRWGMTIDLSSCIGCNACIAACQVENNIPVVGREQIECGREMHWIRVDRYYSGKPENPEVVYQPMLCQHCENAPCETVCPVVATVHNEEGLNQQIYNRCVGTRYCSNNCPYKVRRFNWHEFAFAAYDEHPLELALNPDVTVREKGVMEKCTFCVQRILEGKGEAKQMGRDLRDEDIQTACQQTCPTQAITFGNVNNPGSQVSENLRDERSYHVLEMLNTVPSVTYWTKLRNRPPRDDGDHHDGEEHHA